MIIDNNQMHWSLSEIPAEKLTDEIKTMITEAATKSLIERAGPGTVTFEWFFDPYAEYYSVRADHHPHSH